MKLSKSLLSAIVVGIAVQSAVSCTKTALSPEEKAKKEAEKNKVTCPAPVIPEWMKDGCPACGMG